MNAEIPTLLNEADLAERLGVSRYQPLSMVKDGALPIPDGRRRKSVFWKETTLSRAFATLDDDKAAYAPIAELGKQTLQMGYYACPAISSSHIGTRRPTELVLIRKEETGTICSVHTVRCIETEQGVFNESQAFPQGVTSFEAPQSMDDIRATIKAVNGEDEKRPLTVFWFDPVPVVEFPYVGSGVQRGGSINGKPSKDLDPKLPISRFKNGQVTQRSAS